LSSAGDSTAIPFDLAVIGGGVNGCGIARDAAGRGASVVLFEQNDLASATSSASTKLIHGGLRYLEHYEFRLVREALMEREVLWAMAPHIVWPLRFVLPHHKGLRPAWLLRLGLLLYDHIGGRRLLPPTRTLDLRRDAAGKPLKGDDATAFEYSDCWVEDSRLVVLNAADAAARGAQVRTRTKVVAADRVDGLWRVTTEGAAGRGTIGAANNEADIHLLRFGEHLLSSAIGAASSRLVLSLLLRRRNLSTEAAFKLLDDASAALQYNRDILQHGLDHAGQGITVLDRDLRLLAWNQAFIQLYDLPPSLVRFGTGLDEVVRYNAARGAYGDGEQDELMAARLESFVKDREPVRLKLFPSRKVIEIRSNPLPDGGLVTTYTDITQAVEAQEELERTNETLERRVAERTEEILRVNGELQRAKAGADEALMLDPRGFVASRNSTHFFIVRGRELWTSTSLYSFKGITQQNVIDAWRAAGNVAKECDFTLAQVYSADEAFVTGTLGGVTPVTKVDGRLIADGKAGKVTKEASDLYLKSVGAL